MTDSHTFPHQLILHSQDFGNGLGFCFSTCVLDWLYTTQLSYGSIIMRPWGKKNTKVCNSILQHVYWARRLAVDILRAKDVAAEWETGLQMSKPKCMLHHTHTHTHNTLQLCSTGSYSTHTKTLLLAKGCRENFLLQKDKALCCSKCQWGGRGWRLNINLTNNRKHWQKHRSKNGSTVSMVCKF